MAGVEFGKYGASALGEMGVHYDTQLRMDDTINHSNKDIDRTRTHLNYSIGVASWNELVEKCEKAATDADALNPPKRVRKDRKYYFSLEVYCPPELVDTPQEDEFFQKVYEMYKEYLPIQGGFVHKDERHEYYDSKKDEMVMSRDHMDLFGACITSDGRLNCHDLINKEMCQKVNDDIQAMCLKEFQVSYQTGEGRTGSYKSVEELKQESQVRLEEKLAKEEVTIKKNTIKEMDDIIKMNENIISSQDAQIEEQATTISQNNDVLETQKKALEDVCSDLDEQQSLLNEITIKIANENEIYINAKKMHQQDVKNMEITYEEFYSSMNAFLKIAVPALTVVLERAERLLKSVSGAIKEKLQQRLEKPQSNATNAVEKGRKALDLITNKNIVFGSKSNLDLVKKVTKELDDASKSIQNETLNMHNIMDEEEEEDLLL